MEILEVISQPFMQRALISGLIVAILCGSVGVFLTLKKKSFMSDGIAHGSLAGVAIGIALGVNPVYVAMIVAILMAILITYIRKNSTISQDSAIGIVFPILFAIGIIILNLTPGYKAEISTYLFGQILAVRLEDLLIALTVLLISGGYILFNYSQLTYATFDNEAAFIRGIKVNQIEYVLNIFLALTIVVSIKLVGIIMVSALLIIAPSSAKIQVSRFNHMIPFSILQNLISVLIGMIVSILINVSPGPMIVIVSAAIFFLILGINSTKRFNMRSG